MITKKDDERCKKCKYHGWLGAYVVCNHILIEKNARGCHFGVACTKFEPRTKTRRKAIKNT